MDANGDHVTLVYNYIPIPHFVIPLALAAFVLMIWWNLKKRS
ncbi:MAG TPA: hypothetical protein VGC39_01215 [Candidatus Methylacidiphilales bacterium]